jgi:hypothetical protein
MHPFRPLARLALAAGCLVFAACGGDETQGTDDHTPTSFTVLVNDAPAGSPLALTVGVPARIRIKYENAEGEDLDEVEAEHFGGLVFSPASLATAARDADHHFQFDVVPVQAGTGTIQVSYGHDEAADEVTFPATSVIVSEP